MDIFKLLFTTCILLFSVTLLAQDVVYLQNGCIATIQPSCLVTVYGGIKSEEGSKITINGDLLLKNNTINNQADWTDFSVVGVIQTGSIGKVYFQSDHPQNFSGNTGFPNLYMESSGGLNLNNDIKIGNKLHLTRGIITTNSNFLILQNPSNTSLEADILNPDFSKSYIDGHMRRFINATNTDYNFALGTSKGNNLVFSSNLSNPVTGVNYLDVSFAPKTGASVPINLSESGITYSEVLSAGVWKILPDQPVTGGVYDLKLYFDGFSPLADNNFAIVRRPTGSVSDADWAIPAGSNIDIAGGIGRKLTDGFAMRFSINGFSQFGIAVTNTPLPLKLLNFTAINEKNYVKLNWETTQEINTDNFIIERSSNGNRFSSIGEVKASGNSSATISYSYKDLQPIKGNNFYRLKMVDKDGKFTYSNIIVIKLNDKDKAFLVFPNPAKDILFVQANGNNEAASIMVIDVAGRKLKEKKINLNGNSSFSINIKDLPPGVYNILLKGKNNNDHQKFVKE